MKHQPSTVRSATAAAEKTREVPRPASRIKTDDAPKVRAMDDDEGRMTLIRETAYTLYVARSSVDGHELDDWLQAEAQVNQMAARGA